MVYIKKFVHNRQKIFKEVFVKITTVLIQTAKKFFDFFQPQPVIRPKSAWQIEVFCINYCYRVPGCKKAATHEAYFRRGKHTASILCCSNLKCQEKAKEVAKQ